MIKSEKAPANFRKLVYREKWYASAYQTASYVRTTNIELDGGEEEPEKSTNNIVTSENLECVAYSPVSEFRNVSPTFFRENPAMLHRISHFMQRDLRAIKGLRDSINPNAGYVFDDPFDTK